MSIDDYAGEAKGAASLLFRNQDALYPDFTARDLRSEHPGIEFVPLARDGASTIDLVHDQLSNLDHFNSPDILFTITGGGNDILSLQADADDIIFRLKAVVMHLRRRYPRCVLLLSTIYDPTDGVGDLFDAGMPLERELAVLQETNVAIRQMADPPSVRVADVHRRFLGHGAHSKDPKSPHYHPDDPSLWYVFTIEPNARGAHEIRRLFWEALHETNEGSF